MRHFLIPVKNALVNRMGTILPMAFFEKRHQFKNRHHVLPWLNDDPQFIHIPKSGGTSIAKALGRKESGHFTYRYLSRHYPHVADKQLFYFVMRNPVDRLVSTYTYILDLHRKFGSSIMPQAYYAADINEFICQYVNTVDITRHFFLRPVSDTVAGIGNNRLVAINFDVLSAGFADFSEQFMHERILLPHTNASEKKGSTMILSNESLKVITEKYARDLALYEEIKHHPFVYLSELSSQPDQA